MRIQETLAELESVAEKKGIRVAYEGLGGEVGSGGLCRVKGEYRIIIDKRASPGERLTVLARALAGFPIDDVTVSDEAKEAMRKAVSFQRR